MDLFDTNIFLIERFLPREPRYESSRKAINLTTVQSVGVTVFTWLEFLGIASFNVNSKELAELSYDFEKRYQIEILYPVGLEIVAREWWSDIFIEEILEMFTKKITFGDAALLWVAEQHQIERIITWNPKHFQGKTSIQILTPEEYIA